MCYLLWQALPVTLLPKGYALNSSNSFASFGLSVSFSCFYVGYSCFPVNLLLPEVFSDLFGAAARQIEVKDFT